MPSPGNQFLSNEFGDIEDYFVSDYTLIDQYIGDQLWVWGSAYNGRLGTNSLLSPPSIGTPVTTFAGGANWKQVSGGSEYGGGIKTDGTLWMWGKCVDGRLGNNVTSCGDGVPTPVTTFAGGNDWKQISCNGTNTAAIKTDGTLWVWGSGGDGRLGTNDTVDRPTPVTTFAGGNNWKQVSAYFINMAAIKTDGTLWVWGAGYQNPMGVNDGSNRLTPVTTFAGGNDWKQVNGNRAIKTNGTLWVWGINDDGRLGTNDTTTRLTPVTTFAGGSDWKQVSGSAAIKTDGSLWVWGPASNGRLGDNQSSTNKLTPITTFAGGNNWKQVSDNLSHVLAIKTNGTLWAWGRNDDGRLGINTNVSKSTPVTTFAGGTNWKQVSVGSDSSYAIKSGLTVDLT